METLTWPEPDSRGHVSCRDQRLSVSAAALAWGSLQPWTGPEWGWGPQLLCLALVLCWPGPGREWAQLPGAPTAQGVEALPLIPAVSLSLCLQPVDRVPVVCHPDLEERLQAWPAELPDEFFELTVDDVRRRLAQLKSERWVPLGASGFLAPGFALSGTMLPAVLGPQHWLLVQAPDKLPLTAPQRVGVQRGHPLLLPRVGEQPTPTLAGAGDEPRPVACAPMLTESPVPSRPFPQEAPGRSTFDDQGLQGGADEGEAGTLPKGLQTGLGGTTEAQF
ncbi:Tether containing UBX domain for GLUT4 [Plecturocebus cupreus]